MLSFKPTFSLSSFTFVKRLLRSSSLFAIRVMSSYLRLLVFLLAILIPACASSSPAFLMMYSTYKLKGRGTRDQIANIHWIMEKAREFQKNIYFCFIDYARAFECVDHNKLWKILKEMGIPDHLTCLLRSLYAGQEATVRTGHGTTDWFQIGKGIRQSCILSPCLFNLYAEYIMRNAGLEEAQAGIKIARRNDNNLRYVDDTTLMIGRK